MSSIYLLYINKIIEKEIIGMNWETFVSTISEGIEFPKAKVKSKILKIDEDGISYSIGSKGNHKKVTFTEFQAAFKEIEENGCITRNWYNTTFPIKAKTSSCNFTTIGSLLQYFSYVTYSTGAYSKK